MATARKSLRQLLSEIRRMRSSHSLHDEIDAIPEDGETSGKNPIPANPLTVADVVPSPPPQKETCACRPDQTPWWKSFLEVGAFVVAIVFARIYWGQWDAMEKQLTEMQRTTYVSCVNTRIARSTLTEYQRSSEDSHLASVASYAQALVAMQSLKTFVDADFTVPGNRPYGQSLSVLVRLKNTGKSDASNVRIAGWAILAKPKEALRR